MPKNSLLIEQCKQGNKKSQIKLYDLYCDAMFAISCRYLQNTDEAMDAMQKGFLKAFFKLESYTNTISFGAWLKRIIINQCIDDLRKKTKETISLTQYPLEIVDDNNWEFDTTITKNQILEEVKKLPEKHQLVVKLYLFEGYDHSEISEIVGIPIKTSRTHLRRGKLQLQELLKAFRYEARY